MSAAEVSDVVEFLDQFRAGEALGEASLAAWITVSDRPAIRGALRTIRSREGSHARLLAERIAELGASPRAEIPAQVHAAVMSEAASADRDDAAKLRAFVGRFPDCAAAVRPIHDMADRLDHDPETQSLLRTIAQDELATLETLHAACRRLSA